MKEVPPIPKSIPIAIKIRNTGVASDTAANISASFVCPMKKASAKLYTSTIIILMMDGMTLLITAFGTGAYLNISIFLSLFIN